jgi:hypothetical protein
VRIDISKEILSFAERGIYTAASERVGASIFERLTTDEMEQMFDLEGQEAKIKPWLREGISWQLGDASLPESINALERQDIVVANNFLCHMEPSDAQNCLQNIATMVDREGYLFVSGVDIEVREKVAREHRWQPTLELLEQIHDGDPSVREGWPWCCWGLAAGSATGNYGTRPFSRFRINRPFDLNGDAWTLCRLSPSLKAIFANSICGNVR